MALLAPVWYYRWYIVGMVPYLALSMAYRWYVLGSKLGAIPWAHRTTLGGVWVYEAQNGWDILFCKNMNTSRKEHVRFRGCTTNKRFPLGLYGGHFRTKCFGKSVQVSCKDAMKTTVIGGIAVASNPCKKGPSPSTHIAVT